MSDHSFDTPRTQVQTDLGAPLDFSLIERRCRLTVLSGERRGASCEVEGTSFLVGKGEGSHLVLPDPTVSREHFSIEQTQGGFVIRDHGSTNGTWIDQFRIREAYLRPGVTVRAGEVQLKFEPLFQRVEIQPSAEERFGSLIGRSVRMRQIFTLLSRVAGTDATVVLLGETGSGKSAVARAVHNESARAKKPFVTVDCGAIAENLIESELFGHARGAFTGAVNARKGALEQAQGGTLFIDELVDLPLHLQPRLLRVLEEREVRRVGGNEPIRLDVRIIAASRKDLWTEVQAGRFREDLYFRLAVFTIPLPALRERAEDIPMLAAAFADELKGGDALAASLRSGGGDALKSHPFYGNVRELRNVIERAVHLGEDPVAQLGAGGAPPSHRVATQPVAVAPDASTPRLAGPPVPVFGGAPSVVDPVVPAPVPAPLEVTPAPVAPSPVPAAGAASADGTMSFSTDCGLPFKVAKEKLLDAFEHAYLARLISRSESGASAMARAAEIDRKYLYTLAKKHGFDISKKS